MPTLLHSDQRLNATIVQTALRMLAELTDEQLPLFAAADASNLLSILQNYISFEFPLSERPFTSGAAPAACARVATRGVCSSGKRSWSRRGWCRS